MSNDIFKKIFQWYSLHRRTHLPWRNTRDPYRILVSEVMLQQTQVERVIPKYRAFMKQFPSARALAGASTGDVIRAWAGLGYNRRALFLQRAAKAMMREPGGQFPRTLDALKKLPGVGDYTARAILSFSFLEPIPMMDTNHRRFYQRVFFGLRKKDDATLLHQAERVISKISPPQRERRGGGRKTKNILPAGKTALYTWNQALMDFGSLVCIAGRPLCETCPVQKYCRAYPAILRKKSNNGFREKKNIPFRESDRYFRGRIVDLLRGSGKIRKKEISARFRELSDERLRNIIEGLEKDGLIRTKKEHILLP